VPVSLVAANAGNGRAETNVAREGGGGPDTVRHRGEHTACSQRIQKNPSGSGKGRTPPSLSRKSALEVDQLNEKGKIIKTKGICQERG